MGGFLGLVRRFLSKRLDEEPGIFDCAVLSAIKMKNETNVS
jgi:hypothetical protein